MLTRSYPAATAENVGYTYDSIASGNKGKGRLTSMTHEGGAIAWTYDVRGNPTKEARTIAGAARNVSYAYTAADNVNSITYPSGRQVYYTRDSSGRIVTVLTRKVSSDAWSSVLTSIVYAPQSRLVQSATFANYLTDANSYTQDYETSVLALKDGATSLVNRAHTRTDALNLTNIFDNVTPANNAALWYSPANRLQNADGAWGSETFYYDGVGNRIEQRATPPGGSETIATLGYPATSNRVTQITQNATTVRSIGYDAAGNPGSLPVAGGDRVRGRLYNALHQLITRVVTNSGSLDGTTHYDRPSALSRGRESAAQTISHYVHDPTT